MPTLAGRLLRDAAAIVENTLCAGLALLKEAVARWRGREPEAQKVLPLRMRRPGKASTAGGVNAAGPANAAEQSEHEHDG